MALIIIQGNSGNGKTSFMYKTVIDKSLQEKRDKFLIITPDQYTMQAQKDIVKNHPNKGYSNIDILSFSRLALKVNLDLGIETPDTLDELGKTIVLRKVASLCKDDLLLLKDKIDMPGFISEIKSIISELDQYNIDVLQLQEEIKDFKNKPVLAMKIEDISTIYKKFLEYIKDKFVTSEEILIELSNRLYAYKDLKNTEVFLDGFTGFTPIQYKVLEELVRYAKNVYVTITIDEHSAINQVDEEDLFYFSKSAITKLKEIAIKQTKPIEMVSLFQDNIYRFRQNNEFLHLEKNLFRYEKVEPFKNSENTSVFSLKTVKEEIAFVRSKVLELVREEGYRYKDIGIIVSNLDEYSRDIELDFSDNNIPFFMDIKNDIKKNPIVELIRALGDLIEKDFSFDCVFRYLRCVMSGFDSNEVDILENYAIEFGIRGFKKWNKEFEKTSRFKTLYNLSTINEIRQRFVESVKILKEEFSNKSANVYERTKALFEFMRLLKVEEKNCELIKAFELKKDFLNSREYGQSYALIIKLFDKIVSLLGEEVLTNKEYFQILDSGFEEIKLKNVPPLIDQVVIGDIERSRLEDIKILIFIGVNDDSIPGNKTNKRLLNQQDRLVLSELGYTLAPSVRESLFIQRFYLYQLLTKPSKKLILTYSLNTNDNKDRLPAYLIGEIKKILGDGIELDCSFLPIYKNGMEKELLAQVTSKKAVLDIISKGIGEYIQREVNKSWLAIYNCYHEEKEVSDIIKQAFLTENPSKIDSAIAKALYGDDFATSVTRLEKYASCAYSHFLKYGINLVERPINKIISLDLGNLYHATLEEYSNRLLIENINWEDIDDIKRDSLLEEIVEKVIRDYNNTALYSSARNEYIKNRVKRVSQRTVWALTEHLKMGKFKPAHYEYKFDTDLLSLTSVDLSNELKDTRLKGKIDRVDIYKDELEHKLYVKIIDYKSGNKKFDIKEVEDGVQMQLVAYMGAVLHKEKKEFSGYEIIPAGAFYFHVKDPVININAKDKSSIKIENEFKEIINNLRKKEYTMSGLINSDEKVIKLIEENFKNESIITNVKVKSSGEIKEEDYICNGEQIEKIINNVYKKMDSLTKDMLKGDIKQVPYDKEKNCKYCEFSEICEFALEKVKPDESE